MKEEDKLIEKYGKDSGMKVPPGFFDDFEKRVLSELPSYPQETKKVDLSAWQRFKPYIYLAAMFCGIWLMMKLFHTVSQPLSQVFDNPPEAIVQLLDNHFDEVDYINYYSSMPDFLIEEEMAMEYDSMEDFEKAFYSE